MREGNTLERLELGKFERLLFVTLVALMAAVVNLGIRLNAKPASTIDDSGSHVVSYDSRLTDSVFTAREIQPLALVPVPQSSTSTPSQNSAQTQPPAETSQPQQATSEATRANIFRKLL